MSVTHGAWQLVRTVCHDVAQGRADARGDLVTEDPMRITCGYCRRAMADLLLEFVRKDAVNADCVTVLVRKTNPVRWEVWGRYRSRKEAELTWETHIQGRGVTAWTWIGPTPVAERMLKDPDYQPLEGKTVWDEVGKDPPLSYKPVILEVTKEAYDKWEAEHVRVDPGVLGGSPVFAGSRLSVDHIGWLPESDEEATLRDYPYLSRKDIVMARLFARRRVPAKPWEVAAARRAGRDGQVLTGDGWKDEPVQPHQGMPSFDAVRLVKEVGIGNILEWLIEAVSRQSVFPAGPKQELVAGLTAVLLKYETRYQPHPEPEPTPVAGKNKAANRVRRPARKK